MQTVAPSRRRGPVSELKALGLKPERRQGQLGEIPAHGVGGWSGSEPWLPERHGGIRELESCGTAAELPGDLAIRTNYCWRLPWRRVTDADDRLCPECPELPAPPSDGYRRSRSGQGIARGRWLALRRTRRATVRFGKAQVNALRVTKGFGGSPPRGARKR